VRLLVVQPDRLQHRVFRDLPDLLQPGDLVVVNTSATLPAATRAVVDGTRVAPVHVAGDLDDGSWVVEVRRPDGSGPDLTLDVGAVLDLRGGVRLALTGSYPQAGRAGTRLWAARAHGTPDRLRYLAVHGAPITYAYLRTDLRAAGRLEDHQTVYAGPPGSAEMVSAGRPFSEQLVTRLVTRGVTVAPLVLHTGVSSPDKHEPPVPERYEVPPDTARLVNSARKAGRRVVAVGTTVVRALETAARPDGEVVAARGWTDLVLDGDHPACVVDGLVTGLHEPQASHLTLLQSVAGTDLVQAAYTAASQERYLWHEFGDSMLFLP
jgi:S-adenosylmethionine:tRNA ribosyltransferase-isomerase